MKKTVDNRVTGWYNNQRRQGRYTSFGGLAQLGERLHGMQEVSGSIPLFSTKKALYFVGSMVLFFFSAAKNGGCTALPASFSDVLQAVQCSPRVIGASAGQKVTVQLTISSI